jgi:hypothetical protein
VGPALGGYLAGLAFGWKTTAALGAAAVFALAACTFFVLPEQRVTQVVARSVHLSERQRVPVGVLTGLVAMTGLAIALLNFPELRNVGYSLFGLAAAFAAVVGLMVVRTRNPVVAGAQVQLAQIFRSTTLWLALGMVFLFYMVPGFNTALVYQQSDVLGFSKPYIGVLGSVEGVFGVLAAVLYVFVCRKLTLRALLTSAIAFAAVSTYLYLFYSSKTAPFIHALYGSSGGFALTLVELSMMDLAIRATPRGCEALGFSLLMSVRNFGTGINDVIGTQMMDQYHVAFNTLIVINASTTLAVLLFIPLLPAAIVSTRERR